MLTVQNGRVISGAYANGAKTRSLAESTVNLVMGQIRDATADTDPVTGKTVAWASQPGAIRTYNDSGQFARAFKLYSSSQMVTTTASDLSKDVPSTDIWQNEPGLYVNLNDPVARGANTYYPIADPTLAGAISGYNVSDANYQKSLAMPVQWIYVLQDGTMAGATYQNGKTKVTGATAANPIVGRIAFWTDDETAKLNLNTSSEGLFWDTPRALTYQSNLADAPSKFLNSPGGLTASPYNVTTMENATKYDVGLAFVQPAAHEYNRYPGHPAMDCLSVVFPNMSVEQIFNFIPTIGALNLTNPQGSQFGTYQVNYASTQTATALFKSSPSNRLFATVADAAMNPIPGGTNDRSVTSAAAGISADDIRVRDFLLTTSGRASELNLFNRPRIAMWPVSKYLNTGTGNPWRTGFDNTIAFCSTLINGKGATGSYPFVFLREKKENESTSIDAQDVTGDGTTTATVKNLTLYKYLQDLTSRNIPGFGGNFQAKYPSGNCSQLLLEALDYIRCTNSFDGSLEPASHQKQTPTTGNEFTYGIQGGYNALAGHGEVVPLQINGVSGLGRAYTVNDVSLMLVCTADGTLPSSDPGSLANHSVASTTANPPYYRNITLPLPQPTAGPEVSGTNILTSTQKCIQAMLLVSLATPMQGYPIFETTVRATIQGGDQCTVNGIPIFPQPASPTAGVGIDASRNYTLGGIKAGLQPVFNAAFGYFGFWTGIGGEGYAGPFNFKGYSAYVNRSKLSALPNDSLVDTWGFNGGSADTIIIGAPPAIPCYLISDPFIVSTTKGLDIEIPQLTITLSYMKASGTAVPYQTITIPAASWSNEVLPGLAAGSSNLVHRAQWWSLTRTTDVYGGKNPSIISGKYTNGLGRLWNVLGNINADTFVDPNDVVRCIHIVDGDLRANMAMTSVPATRFKAMAGGGIGPVHSITVGLNQNPTGAGTGMITNPNKVFGRTVATTSGGLASGASYDPNVAPDYPTDPPSNSTKPSATGDWENGIGDEPDGPWANFPDAGQWDDDNQNTNAKYQINPFYFSYPGADVALGVFSAPNRQIPSPGMLGSLPVSVGTSTNPTPWRTLLFRPQASHPSYNGTPLSLVGNAPGSNAPFDHLFMDLFWMPIVEPYALSDGFSTEGKVNMNYGIVPFTYIERSTALYAVLKSEKMMMIPTSEAAAGTKNYKTGTTTPYRHNIDAADTLKEFQALFDAGDIFRSASQICDIDLVPQSDATGTFPTSGAAVQALFGNTYSLTGDNTRERPYADLYGRLTTRSNTYRVHYRVQILKKLTTAGADPTVFIDPNDQTGAGTPDIILSESRGSYLVERYIDSNDSRWGSTNFDPYNNTLTAAYKFRVTGAKEFNP
jgi:hypothetical protein